MFSADTGTSVGEIMGQSKPINSVDFRAERPFRIVTASEDNTLAFFHGPPFKFQFTLQVNSCISCYVHSHLCAVSLVYFFAVLKDLNCDYVVRV